jgi:hypothetical protein
MRVPHVGDLEAISPPTIPVGWKPQPLSTGPIEAIAPPPAPPPSQRHFAPPPSAPHVHAISSARVRQSAPIDAPPYSPPYPSQQGPVAQPQPTGPQQPVPMQHPPTGSFPAAPSPEEGMHLGYVVASAFFLAIALVGFGLYLAFEVISL